MTVPTNQTMRGKAVVLVSESERLPTTLTGTVVSGDTLRPQDLILAFRNMLHFGWPSKLEWLNVEYGVNVETDLEAWVEAHPEHAQNLIEELVDALSEIAPEGTSFGTHEGDGACFGFWAFDYGDTKRDDLMDEAREVAADQAFERFSEEDPRDDDFDEDKWHSAPEPIEEPPFDDGRGLA